MYDDEDDDNAIFLLVLGVLAGVLAVVTWWSQAGGDSIALTAAPAATAVPAPTAEPEPEPAPVEAAAAAYTIDLGTDAGLGGAPTAAVLTGVVGSEAARQAAEDAALANFDSVDNQLTIVDDGTISTDLPPDITIIGSSTEGIKANTGSAYAGAANNLTVVEEPAPAVAAEYTVDLGTNAGLGGAPIGVVLTGQVGSAAASQAAEDAAAANFDTVDNQLTIVDDGTISTDLPPIVTIIGSTTDDVSASVDGAYGGPAYAATNNLTIVEDTTGQDLVASLNELFALEPIQFDTGSAAIRAESEPTLDQAVEALTAVPSGDVEIQGHTDDQGSESSNQTLSQDRADSVLAYLVGGGVAADRLTAVGYGEGQPIADNATAEGRQQNRRIEFKLVE